MKILIVSTSQFGYLIDYHRYYSYLKNRGHEVKFLTFDWGKEKIDGSNPDIIYVTRKGGMLARLPRLIKATIDHEKKTNFDRIMVNCFKMSSLLLLSIPNEKMYLDIRQVSIHTKKYKRLLFDSMMQFAAKRFKNTSILTDLAAKHLGISRYKLLPLGGAYFPPPAADDPAVKQYRELLTGSDFIFLYVGTLHKRRIIDCVTGFHEYLKKHPQTAARFIIIGDAIGNDLVIIKQYIADNKLDNYIFALGYIPQQRLAFFFGKANCGISYLPVTPFNDVQPNTKTYEYLINGIPVIATSTKDNVRLLTTSGIPCGIVIDDNTKDFEKAVGEIISNRHQYNKEAIAEKFSRYEWDHLFREYLDDVLDLPQEERTASV